MVSDTRFMAEAGLRSLLSSLVRLAEGSLSEAVVAPTVDEANCLKSHISQLFTTVISNLFSSSSVSRASAAWFEIQLVEVALRNRDRFGAVWPCLAEHYSRTLSGPVSDLSYVTERFGGTN